MTRIPHFECNRCGERQDGQPRMMIQHPYIETQSTPGTTFYDTPQRVSTEDLCDECSTALRAWMNWTEEDA